MNDCLKLSPVGDCSTGKHGPIDNWDVSQVDNIGYLFFTASEFNGNVSTWDVSKVKDTQCMFYGAGAFDQDLSKWDVSKVTYMQEMFELATAFNQDLSKWDISQVTSIARMFFRASSFEQVLCGEAWVKFTKSNTYLYAINQLFSGSAGEISETCGMCGSLT